jgi:hypothetical protein
MVEIAGITGATAGARTPRRSDAPAPFAAPSAPSPTGTQEVSAISPRIITDSTTGVVITQFLGVNDTVQVQTPSAAAVAYLRIGLTASGEPHSGDTLLA